MTPISLSSEELYLSRSLLPISRLQTQSHRHGNGRVDAKARGLLVQLLVSRRVGQSHRVAHRPSENRVRGMNQRSILDLALESADGRTHVPEALTPGHQAQAGLDDALVLLSALVLPGLQTDPIEDV